MKWFTVSKNPIGMFGEKVSYHVEPGKVSGHHHIKALNMKQAIKKVYGK